MKLLHLSQSLFAPVDDGSGGGGGAGSPAVFDQAAFSAQILASVNKALTGFQTTYKADFAKLQAPPAAVVDPAIVDPDLADKGVVKPPADPALAAQLRVLERRLKEAEDRGLTLKTESDATKLAAEKKEQDATVRTKLNKFKFADDAAAEDAFEIFGSKVKRNDEGAFVGADGTPLDQYLEEGMRAKPYLLAPKDAGSAGARNGKGPGGGKAFEYEDIKAGMSQADIVAASQAIAAALQR